MSRNATVVRAAGEQCSVLCSTKASEVDREVGFQFLNVPHVIVSPSAYGPLAPLCRGLRHWEG